MKKVFGILLAAAMLMTCLAVPAMAASSSGGSGGGGVISTASSGSSTGVTGVWTYYKNIDKWTFTDNSGVQYKSRWAYVYNPYSRKVIKSDWFYFDADGYMMTDWVWVKGADGKARCYFLNPVSDGDRGACQLGGTVKDAKGTWNLDSNGAWTVNGTVQTK